MNLNEEDQESELKIRLSREFPREVWNRPGLSHLEYRLGTYSSIRDAFLRKLDRERQSEHSSSLREFTYRGSDDTAIALMESTSVVCDILTFYQELYANEAFLRTAQWRESISRLVELTGYILTPGTAAEACFVADVRKEVSIPKGFPIRVQLEQADETIQFEVKEDLTAYSEFNRVTLHHCIEPVIFPKVVREKDFVGPAIYDASNIFYLPKDNSKNIKPKDRLVIFLLNDESEYYNFILDSDIVIVDKVWESFGRTFILTKGEMNQVCKKYSEFPNSKLCAFLLGRTFRHFGFNAPPYFVDPDNTELMERIRYTRFLIGVTSRFGGSSGDTTFDIVPEGILPWEVPLSADVDDLLPGTEVLLETYNYFPYDQLILAEQSNDYIPPHGNVRIIKKINQTTKKTFNWGTIAGSSTVLEFDLFDNVSMFSDFPDDIPDADIRKFFVHELIGKCFEIRPGFGVKSDDEFRFIVSGNERIFSQLSNRELFITHSERENYISNINAIVAVEDDGDLVSEFLLETNCREVVLDRAIGDIDDYQYDSPENLGEPISSNHIDFVIYGNLLRTTQGKTEIETILGSGDSRQSFQRFKIPKTPLTFISESPELKIHVNNTLWTHVPSLFGRTPSEQIYIVREDENGDFWVQFGDGNAGARLPSGIDNVTAVYRTGVGAKGRLKDGTSVQPGKTLQNLGKLDLLTSVSAGLQSETGQLAQETAPKKLQSLDRMVSLQDYEGEVASLPNVMKARVTWEIGIDSFLPFIQVTALMEEGGEEKLRELKEKIRIHDKDRGPRRVPIHVTEGSFKDVKIEAEYLLDPEYRNEDVLERIKLALGVVDSDTDPDEITPGLFSLSKRNFGHVEYKSRIEGIIQNIEGIQWIRVSFLGGFSVEQGTFVPIDETGVVDCDTKQILRLLLEHLNLSQTEGGG